MPLCIWLQSILSSNAVPIVVLSIIRAPHKVFGLSTDNFTMFHRSDSEFYDLNQLSI